MRLKKSRIMNKIWVATTAACLLTVSAMSQTSGSGSASGNSGTSGQTNTGTSVSQRGQADSTAESSGPSNGPLTGASLLAELAKSIDAKKAKSGDEVTAKLTQDLKANGAVVIPKGSKLVGHVTEAQAKTKESAESKLGVVFDKVVLKSGQEVAFTGVIRALSAPAEIPAVSPGGSNMDQNAGSSGRGMGQVAMGGGMSPTTPNTGSTNSTIGSTVGTSGNAAGSVGRSAPVATNGISNDSRGVIGMEGVELNNTAQASVFSSANHNIKLDSGAQIVVQVTGSQNIR